MKRARTKQFHRKRRRRRRSGAARLTTRKPKRCLQLRSPKAKRQHRLKTKTMNRRMLHQARSRRRRKLEMPISMRWSRSQHQSPNRRKPKGAMLMKPKQSLPRKRAGRQMRQLKRWPQMRPKQKQLRPRRRSARHHAAKRLLRRMMSRRESEAGRALLIVSVASSGRSHLLIQIETVSIAVKNFHGHVATGDFTIFSAMLPCIIQFSIQRLS